MREPLGIAQTGNRTPEASKIRGCHGDASRLRILG